MPLKYWMPPVIASLLLTLNHFSGQERLLGWDEVDYVVAAGQGLKANFLDSTAPSASLLVRLMRNKAQNLPVPETAEYDEANDIFIRRHMHPPLMQYLMNLTGIGRSGETDQDPLIFQFAGGLALVFMMNACLNQFLAESPDVPTILSSASCMFLCSFQLTREIQYHLWFATSICLVALTLCNYVKSPSRRSATQLGFCLGLSFLSLETGLFAFVFVIFILICDTIRTNRHDSVSEMIHQMPWRNLMIASLVMSFTIFLLWPASVLKLSLPRILAIYAYRIKLGSEYGGGNTIYLQLLERAAPLILVAALGIIHSLKRNESSELIRPVAFLAMGLLYGLTMIKFMLNLTYMMPALVLLCIPGLFALSQIRSFGVKSAIATVICISTIVITLRDEPALSCDTRDGMNELAKWVTDYPAIMEAGHIFQFYMPELKSQIRIGVLSKDGGQFTERQNMKYVPLSNNDMKNHLILFYNRPDKPVSKIETEIQANARKIIIPGIGSHIYLFSRESTLPEP